MQLVHFGNHYLLTNLSIKKSKAVNVWKISYQTHSVLFKELLEWMHKNKLRLSLCFEGVLHIWRMHQSNQSWNQVIRKEDYWHSCDFVKNAAVPICHKLDWNYPIKSHVQDYQIECKHYCQQEDLIYSSCHKQWKNIFGLTSETKLCNIN